MKLTNSVAIIVFTFTAVALAQDKPKACPQAGSDFAPIFDGKTLKGWHVSTKTGHGTAASVGRQGRRDHRHAGQARQRRHRAHRRAVRRFRGLAGDGQRLRPGQRPVPPQHRGRQVLPGHDRLPRQRQRHGRLRRGHRRVRRPQLPHARDARQDQAARLPEVPLPGHARAVEDLLEEGLEPGAGPHHRQPAASRDLDQRRQVHGLDGHRETPARQGQHRRAGPRRRRSDQAVRALPQHPRPPSRHAGQHAEPRGEGRRLATAVRRQDAQRLEDLHDAGEQGAGRGRLHPAARLRRRT